jgi:O-antigen ligase
MSKNPPAVFMLFLSVFLFITEASFRNRELDDSSIDFQVILRLIVWFVITLYSFVCYKKIFNLLLDSNAKYLTFYCFFCLITTIYSPIPIYTGVNSLIQFSFLIFAAALAVNLNLKQICLAIFYMSIFFHVISLILVPILPELTVMEYWGQGEIGGQRITGLSGSANAYGQMAGLAIVITQYLKKNMAIRQPIYFFTMLLFIICIIFSWSRTSIFITIIGLFLIEKELVKKYFSYGVAMLFFIIISYFSIFNIDDLLLKFSRNGSIEEILTFTGRTDIWLAVWNEAILSPIWGYGYASTKLLLPQIFETDWGWSTVTAHSMFFQLFFTTGMVGVILFSTALYIFYKLCRILNNVLLNYVFFLIVINGLLESGVVGPVPNKLTFLFFLFFLVSVRMYYESKCKDEN